MAIWVTKKRRSSIAEGTNLPSLSGKGAQVPLPQKGRKGMKCIAAQVGGGCRGVPMTSEGRLIGFRGGAEGGWSEQRPGKTISIYIPEDWRRS